MSTKTTNTSTASFNPASMGTYQNLVGAAGGALQGNINNPFGNAFFQQQMGQSRAALAAGSGSAMDAYAQRSNALGISPTSGAYSAGLNNLNRQAFANSARSTNNLFLGAYNARNASIGQAMGFRPLQTGGTNVQTTGGAGSWVAPILAGGLAAANSVMDYENGKQGIPPSNSQGAQMAGQAIGDSYTASQGWNTNPGTPQYPMSNINGGGAFGEGWGNSYGNPNNSYSNPFMSGGR